MSNCPDDFYEENGPFLAFEKIGYTGTDQRTDGRWADGPTLLKIFEDASKKRRQ